MRILILLALVATLTLPAISMAERRLSPQPVTLEELVKKVSNENFNVYSSALRVYQARESIRLARGNLLPKLNVWKLIGTLADPTSIVGNISDVAPFLVPANWFRVQETKLLYLAEKEGYRALWANELMTAKALYIHLLRDKSLYDHIEQSRAELDRLHQLIYAREVLGGAPQGSSREIEVRLLELQEDKRNLEVLVSEERSLLSFMMALPAQIEAEPAPVKFPDFDSLVPLKYEDFVFRAIDSSPEIRQFDHFIQAADFVRRELRYSFLGSASMSRGTAGGIFDHLPEQDGLGFGTPAAMRITSAQKEILKTQRKALEETIVRQLKLLVGNYNLDLESYFNLRRRVQLTQASLNQLYARLELGQYVDTMDLAQASRNHIEADTALFAISYRFLTSQDKLSRLIFQGDYSMQPITIESLQNRGSQ